MLIAARAAAADSDTPGDRALRLQREDVQALLLELVAQPRLAVGDVHAFDDFAGGGGKPAAELHGQAAWPRAARISSRPQEIVSMDIQ